MRESASGMRIVCPSGFISDARVMRGTEIETLARESDRQASGTGAALVFKSCWVSTENAGPYTFSGAPDYKRMLSGDVLVTLIQHRISLFGSIYDVPFRCETCGERCDIEAHLDELELKPLPAASVAKLKANELFEDELLDGTKFKFELPTQAREEYLAAQLKQMSKRPEWQDHKVTFIDGLASRTRWIDGLMNQRGDENVSDQFVKRLEYLQRCDAPILYDMQEKMQAPDCGIDTGVEFRCQHCGWEQVQDFPLGRRFFSPRTKRPAMPKTTEAETTPTDSDPPT